MKSNPIINVPASRLEKVINLLSLFLLVASFAYAIISYRTLPEKIPMHFNSSGEIDGWGPRGSIFVIPIITVIIFVPMYFVSKFPYLFNYPVKITEENAERIYKEGRLFMVFLNFSVVVIMLQVVLDIVRGAQGQETSGLWFLVFPLFVITIFIIRMIRRK